MISGRIGGSGRIRCCLRHQIPRRCCASRTPPPDESDPSSQNPVRTGPPPSRCRPRESIHAPIASTQCPQTFESPPPEPPDFSFFVRRSSFVVRCCSLLSDCRVSAMRRFSEIACHRGLFATLRALRKNHQRCALVPAAVTLAPCCCHGDPVLHSWCFILSSARRRHNMVLFGTRVGESVLLAISSSLTDQRRSHLRATQERGHSRMLTR